MTEEKQVTDIWRKYRAGVEHHRSKNLYRRDERCWHFYTGDQWWGMSQGGQELPMENIIKPILKYKIAMVATTDTTIVYSEMSENLILQEICSELSSFAKEEWERTRMDELKWKVVKAAAITGDSYVYACDTRPESSAVVQDTTPKIDVRMIDRSAVYLADEQEQDLQQQAWIIIAERLPVEVVRRQARENGLSEEQIELIVSDAETDTRVNNNQAEEVKQGDGKCTSLVYFTLVDDEKGAPGEVRKMLRFGRSTEQVVYQPLQGVPGMDVYPIAQMRWEDMPNSARGVGECEPLIPNQIEINKTLARRSLIVKRYGYPTAVYDAEKIDNPAALQKVGAAVRARNLSGMPITNVVQYLEPRTTSGEGAALQQELIATTRELEGASDNATGQVDVTKTSGEAIKAARDQAAMVLNDQAAAYKSFVEQLARIWYKLWCAYSPQGMTFLYKDPAGGEGMLNAIITPQALAALDMQIKIDVSPADPYSVLSQQTSLDNALGGGHITFEEWVSVLDANSPVPAAKFRKILEERKAAQQEMAAQQAAAQGQGVANAAGLEDAVQQAAMQEAAMQGGGANAVQSVPV